MKLKPTGVNITLFALLIIAIVVGAPLAVIWALNTIFPALAIAYTFETWLATFIMSAVLGRTQVNKGK
jgi:hypothetical protein